MNRIKISSFLVIVLHCSTLCSSKYDNVAFCLDLKGNVFREGVSRNGKVFKGDIIYNGDKITVSFGGNLTIRNIHERSKIKIFENSSIKVLTKKNRVNGKKEFELAIFGGRVIVDKNELNDSRLIINSPSSNVFLKNSHFIIHCINKPFFDQASFCIFTSIEGNIIVENSKSKKLLFLNNGESIISTPEGDFFQIETFLDDENIRNSIDQQLIPY